MRHYSSLKGKVAGLTVPQQIRPINSEHPWYTQELLSGFGISLCIQITVADTPDRSDAGKLLEEMMLRIKQFTSISVNKGT